MVLFYYFCSVEFIIDMGGIKWVGLTTGDYFGQK